MPRCYSMPTSRAWLYKSFPGARKAEDHFYPILCHHFPLSTRQIGARVTFLNSKPDHVIPSPETFSSSLIALKRIRSSWRYKIWPWMFLQSAFAWRTPMVVTSSGRCPVLLILTSPSLLPQHLSQSLPFPIPCFIFFMESIALWNCYQMQVHVPLRIVRPNNTETSEFGAG